MKHLLYTLLFLSIGISANAQNIANFRAYNAATITNKTSPNSITPHNVGGNIDSVCNYLSIWGLQQILNAGYTATQSATNTGKIYLYDSTTHLTSSIDAGFTVDDGGYNTGALQSTRVLINKSNVSSNRQSFLEGDELTFFADSSAGNIRYKIIPSSTFTIPQVTATQDYIIPFKNNSIDTFAMKSDLGTSTVDSNFFSTHGWRQKGVDSINHNIALINAGSDSNIYSTKAYRQKGIDSVNANISLKFNTADTTYLFRKADSNTNGHAVTLTYYNSHLPSTPSLNSVLAVNDTSATQIVIKSSNNASIVSTTSVSNTNGSSTVSITPNQLLYKYATYQGALMTNTLYSNQIWYMPNNTGTVALTSDIDTTTLSTRAYRQKAIDSLNATIATKGSGTVTSVGLASTSTITVSGTSSPITASGTYSVSIPSSVALAGSPTTTTQSAGDNSTKIATTAYADGAITTERSASVTLTNHRITPRIQTAVSTATLTIASDYTDEAAVTSQSVAIYIAAPSGTPTAGQKLVLRIKDNGTSQNITWSTGGSGGFNFSSDLAAPAATTLGKYYYLGFIWNEQNSRWDNVAQINNF